MDVLQPFRKLSPCPVHAMYAHGVIGKAYPITCHEGIERK